MDEPRRVPFKPSIVSTLVGFSRELRSAGLTVGSGDVLAFCSAASLLDPSDLVDLYWAGRTTLVTRRESIPVYDEVFRRYFLGGADPVRELLTLKAQVTAEAQAVLEVPAVDPAGSGQELDDATLGLMASDAEALRHKSFAVCTPEELAAVRRIMARIRLTPPRRRTRRTRSAPSGRSPDLRRTMRESLRMHGEPAELFWRQRPMGQVLTCAGPSGTRCACTVSPLSSTGGGARSSSGR